MAATLQCLTDGRLMLGVGSGWNEPEYRAFGYDFPRAGTRIDQLNEALQVITQLWREPSATFTGRYYQISNARCDPRPNVPPTLMVEVRGRGRCGWLHATRTGGMRIGRRRTSIVSFLSS
jgi:alkanesulfonate monooxygenase SsuD/methylene tetrahydromethanopterin reductase-like flavin-dependent oxidoreductase (luciferase family)